MVLIHRINFDLNPIKPKWEDVYDAYRKETTGNGVRRISNALIKVCGYNWKGTDDAETLCKWLERCWKGVDVKRSGSLSKDYIIAQIKKFATERNGLPRDGIYIISGSKKNEKHKSHATLWIDGKQDVIEGDNYIEENENACDRVNTMKYPAGYNDYTVYFWELIDDLPNKCGRHHQENEPCQRQPKPVVCTKSPCPKLGICEEPLLETARFCKYERDTICEPAHCPETDIHKKLGCCHVMEIRNRVNNASITLSKIDSKYKKFGGLLKTL